MKVGFTENFGAAEVLEAVRQIRAVCSCVSNPWEWICKWRRDADFWM